ncbi:type II toxin-antitoxin system RelE/ParE family toxin [bacterium]|nr:type II toxin-antitoxin system RelE/ParE family toxin [bacterium]
MKAWEIEYLPEALNDLERLDHSVQIHVLKAVRKIATNPLPQGEGGYGKPLGSKAELNLTGLLKCKLRGDGVRIVYKLVRDRDAVKVIVIGARADEEAYRLAAARRRRHGL